MDCFPANTGLIKELFKREVPEVNSGAVEVKVIARDPGSRTKIAVYSSVRRRPGWFLRGPKGVRVQAVIGELNGEKSTLSNLVKKRINLSLPLSPATGLTVKINAKKPKQLSRLLPTNYLAIGREGQNAKLAGKLTGYHIDIVGEKGTSEKKE